MAIPSSLGGCDAISAFDVDSGAPIYRGDRHVSPGRLTATTDLSIVIAQNSNIFAGGNVHFLYVLRHDLRAESSWTTGQPIVGADFTLLGGIALMSDNDTLLAATGGTRAFPPVRPFWVSRYLLSEVRSPGPTSSARIGPLHGQFEVDGRAVEILPAPDGGSAHVLTEAGTVYSLDTSTMTEVAPAIRIERVVTDNHPAYPAGRAPTAHVTHAVLAMDGRYLISNRWDAAEINVADLVERRAWTLATPKVSYTGGLAVNHGRANAGLLALHAWDAIVTYRLGPSATTLTEVGRAEVAPVFPDRRFQSMSGPWPSIAWSTSGATLIAATDVEGTYEFAIFRVTDDGRNIVPTANINACPNDRKGVFPNDILTANGVSAPPETATTLPPTPTATAAATSTPMPTATVTMSASSTPTVASTSTPMATVTVTRSLVPVYLPLMVREECVPTNRHVDVTLILDASTSMLEPVTTGGNKLDAARSAAGAFLDALHLDAGDQAAVVVFNDTATVLQRLTAERRLLDASFGRIATHAGTRMHLGIDAAAGELTGGRRRIGSVPVIVLLTDGRANPEPAEVAVERAAAAKAAGITVFTIGLGNELDFDALARIASRPEYFYHAPDAAELAAIYAAIAVTVPCPKAAFWGGR